MPMKNKSWFIIDWAGNRKFSDKYWDSFENAEYFLACWFNENDMDYEEWRQEYFIIR